MILHKLKQIDAKKWIKKCANLCELMYSEERPVERKSW